MIFSKKIDPENTDRPTDQITDPTRPDPTFKIEILVRPTRPDIQNRWSVPTLDKSKKKYQELLILLKR